MNALETWAAGVRSADPRTVLWPRIRRGRRHFSERDAKPREFVAVSLPQFYDFPVNGDGIRLYDGRR